jgi:hypothetical protein
MGQDPKSKSLEHRKMELLAELSRGREIDIEQVAHVVFRDYESQLFNYCRPSRPTVKAVPELVTTPAFRGHSLEAWRARIQPCGRPGVATSDSTCGEYIGTPSFGLPTTPWAKGKRHMTTRAVYRYHPLWIPEVAQLGQLAHSVKWQMSAFAFCQLLRATPPVAKASY